jgi:periplasmic divalent cation tolerance protein
MTKAVMDSPILLVLSTFPDLEAAQHAARALVADSLSACVNILPGVRSIYAWKGELCSDDEVLMVIKTSGERLAELTEKLVSMHPYELPELVALPVTGGHHPYLEWVIAATARPAEP